MENQQPQYTAEPIQPNIEDSNNQNSPIDNNSPTTALNQDLSPQSYQAPPSINTEPIYDNTVNSQTQPVPSLGMFGRRISRLGLILGFVYAILPLIIVIVLQLISHFILSSSVNQASSFPVNGGSVTIDNHSSIISIINILSVLVGMITIFVIIPVIISLYVRRFHDLNQSGLLTFLMILPFVSTIIFIYLLVAPGTDTENKYGPPIKSYNALVLIGLKRPTIF